MTHEVLNQVPPLENVNLFSLDPLLTELEFAPQALARLQAFGRKVGDAEFLNLGVLANVHPPNCTPTIDMAIVPIRWSFIPPITN